MVYFFFSSLSWNRSGKSLQISFRPIFIISSILFLLVNIAHGYYNQINFGSWKSLSGSLTSYQTIQEEKLLSNKNGDNIIKKIAESKNPVGFFTEKRFVHGLQTLTTSDERGIFYFYPIFILAIPGLIYLLKKPTAETATMIASVGILIFLYSSWGDPWGGWAFGPRYLIPATSFLSLFITNWVSQSVYIMAKKILLLMLFGFSSAVALLGSLTTNSVPPAVEAGPLHIGPATGITSGFCLITIVAVSSSTPMSKVICFCGNMLWRFGFRSS
jgi:hypothetical protein